jgi:hypothetical protein
LDRPEESLTLPEGAQLLTVALETNCALAQMGGILGVPRPRLVASQVCGP